MQGVLFAKILHMSLIGCWSVAVVLLVRFFLIRFHCERKYAYWLWMVVFVNLCLPLSISGVFSLIPRQVTEFSLTEAGNPEALPAEATYPGELHINVFSGNVRSEAGEEASDILETSDKDTAKTKLSTRILPMAEMIWLVGILCFFVGSLAAVSRLSWSISRRRRVSWEEKERIAEVKGLSSPFLWGLFRPVIYLPAGMEREEKTYIIAHENCHRRRKDHLVKILVFSVTVLHWFNPFVWLAYGLCCRDMEISCDEAVLNRSEKNIRKAYASSILKYAARQNRYVITPLTFGEPSAKSRIQNVLRYRKRNVVVSLLAGLCVIGVAAGLLFRPTEEPEAEETVGEIIREAPEDVTEASDDLAYLTNLVWGDAHTAEETGWNLRDIVDVRKSFADMSYIPEPGTEDLTYLLSESKHYQLYGKGDFESMLLGYEGKYVEVNYPYGSNYMILPACQEADYDGDGKPELAIYFNVKHGTGVYIDTFLMADPTADGELYVYQFLAEDFTSQMQEQISFERVDGGMQAYVEGQPTGYALPDEEGMGPWRQVSVENQARFYYEDGQVKLYMDLEFWGNEDIYVAGYNGNDITAALEYEDGGVFRLKDFTSRNRDLESMIQGELEEYYASGTTAQEMLSYYGTTDIKVLEIHYDSTAMNESACYATAVVLPEGGDSYDYVELELTRTDTDSISGWKVEEILRGK